ncbi:type II toxin-antitoxin system RelE/ParE family toxin [Hoeflea sp.]|uniref:type II toxin-antitoxin system RelE/ParE family toxin n=1 Tax=Hoeflea sp. TaxID=1940281 RepID=UPI0019CCA127|nr:type II toxin-antitoxin system RelE/ParE family toxin [Hoeflea sp.]MBC7283250.1 type II toxin-antitoxin system RelE/ParE family toxin [Hoeflea sp.]
MSCASDLRWFKTYYIKAFPEGKAAAETRFAAVQELLKANPSIGHPSEKIEGVREHRVLHTPFNFLYRVVEDRIEILRVLDMRSDWIGDDDETGETN